MSQLDRWLTTLGYDREPEFLIKSGDAIGARPYAAEIDDILNPQGRIRANAVFCVKETPTICFVQHLSRDRAERIDELRQSLWNQGLITVIIILKQQHLSAMSVLDRQADPEKVTYQQAATQGLWSATEFKTGFVYDRCPEWFTPDNRVDRRLLNNLHEVVKRLRSCDMQSGAAEALMAQVIFLCYLEQRNIIGDHYRSVHGLNNLHSYIKAHDGRGIDSLLDRLAKDFNGDFLRSSDENALWSSIPERAFSVIDQFLSSVDLLTGQGNLWNYDFSQIPVEMISGIYETFLRDRQGKLSAYYTPRHLANFLVEQSFADYSDPTRLKIYDGACGSGILLTTAFRKLLRFAEVRESRKLDLRERIQLMEGSIYGSDIDKTACWITAFSLYLSLLEGLDVRDISLLQRGENVKLPNLIGSNRNISSGPENGDFFSASNRLSSRKDFDIFMSNPPWRESEKDEIASWELWARSQTPPLPLANRQIAAGFAFRAAYCVKEEGRIVLLLPLNLVISKTKLEFRQRWLQLVNIERIINLADIRHLLFPNSVHPCAVVSAKCRSQAEGLIFDDDESMEYWVPKADASLALGRLTMHVSDRAILSSRQFYSDPDLLIAYYWGNNRDIGLLKRLKRFGTLNALFLSKRKNGAWVSGKGFHAPNQSNPSRDLGLLQDLVYLPAPMFPRDIPCISTNTNFPLVKDDFAEVASPGGKQGRLYSGPRVLFTDGMTEDFQVKAVYTEEKFSFQSSIGSIGGNNDDVHLLRFLAAYLRSPLASYLLFMTGSSIAFERPRISVEEIKCLPFCEPSVHPNPDLAAKILQQVNHIFLIIDQANEAIRAAIVSQYEKRLNELVAEYFCLTTQDLHLIEDVMKAIAPSIQPQSMTNFPTPLLKKPDVGEISKYTRTLLTELNRWQSHRDGDGLFNVDLVGDDGFLGAVRISISDAEESGKPRYASDVNIKSLIFDIEESLRQQLNEETLSPLMIPNLIISMGESLYILKFMRKRYWLARTALADADNIVRSIDIATWAEKKL